MIVARTDSGGGAFRKDPPRLLSYSQILVQMKKEFSVGAPLVGALFVPKRGKTGPDEESAAGKPPLRRRIFGSGYAGLG